MRCRSSRPAVTSLDHGRWDAAAEGVTGNFLEAVKIAGVVPHSAVETQQMQASRLGGWYDLNWGRQHDRTSLRMSSRTCRQSKRIDSAFEVHKASGYKDGGENGDQVWEVASAGRVKFYLSRHDAYKGAMKSVRPGDFGDFLEAHLGLRRLRPDYDNVIPLLAIWRDLDGKGRLSNA